MGNSNGRQFGSYLTKKDIERLQRRFLRVTGGRDVVYISQLQMMPELCGNPYIVHIFQLFDTDKDGAITIDEFTRGVQYLATLSDPEEQYKFAFKLYDTDEDGFIRHRELYSMLKQLGTGNVSDAQLDQVVRCTIEEYDRDGDHALSLSEFKALIHNVEAQNKLSLGLY